MSSYHYYLSSSYYPQLIQAPVRCPLPDPGEPGTAAGQCPGAGCARESCGQNWVTFTLKYRTSFNGNIQPGKVHQEADDTEETEAGGGDGC